MKMNRRLFVKKACSVCMAPVTYSFLDGCTAVHYVDGTLELSGISLSKAEFHITKDQKVSYYPYVIVRHERLEFPVCLYRFADDSYSALLMKCTHQGTELQAAGDHLHCPGHGSEFNNKGQVSHGPAESNLRTFRVSVLPERLFIELR